MDCMEARRLASLRMDGELDPERDAALTAHLADCGACREAASFYSEVRGHLAGVPRPDAPGDLTGRVLDALHGRTARIVTIVPLLRVAAAAASIVLVASAAATVYLGQTPRPARAAETKMSEQAVEILLGDLLLDTAPKVGGEELK
jgi:anti-sigma factor RsiW